MGVSIFNPVSQQSGSLIGSAYQGGLKQRLGRILGLSAPRITTRADFARFMQEQAIFTTQKFAYGYCQKRVGRSQIKLMLEEDFQIRMNVCRWDGMAAILSDQLVLCWNRCSHHLTPADLPRLADSLCHLYDEILDAQPPQPHRAEIGWGDMKARFRSRMAALRTAPEDDLVDIMAGSWKTIFDLLPLHRDICDWDHDKIYGSYRLWMIRNVEEIDKCLVPAQVAAALLEPPVGESRP